MRRDTGGLANEAFTSNPIVSLKQKLSSFKNTTNWKNLDRATKHFPYIVSWVIQSIFS